MNLFLGIDLGTTYFKAALFDENGQLRGLGRQFVKKEPHNNITSELPIETFWSTLSLCISEAISMATVTPKDVIAISYSSQANTFCLLDKDLKSLTPFILWTDKRASGSAAISEQSFSKQSWYKRTGLGFPLSEQSCVAKLLWLRRTQPSVWNATSAITTISDYLAFQLTGERVTDGSTSSLLGILDVHSCRWIDEALDFLQLDTSYLSSPHPVGSYTNLLTTSAASRIGLKPGIPVTVGGLDHHMAAIGAGLPQNNFISESTGTVLAAVRYSNEFLPKNEVCIAPGLNEHHFFEMAFDENGASSLEWYQKNYAPQFSIPSLIQLASQTPIGAEGLVAKPRVSSYNDMEGFENIRPSHSDGHFARAILESTAQTLEAIVDRLTAGTPFEAVVPTGGGAMSKFWIQLKADLLGKKFMIPECNEAACLGAAIVGAAGTTHFKDIQEVSKHWIKLSEEINPDAGRHAAYAKWSRDGVST